MAGSDARVRAARSGGLIVERLPGELLVYDEVRDEAHCLHAEAAAVFDLLDGSRTGAEIAAVASEHLSKPVSEARVADVLAERMPAISWRATRSRGTGCPAAT